VNFWFLGPLLRGLQLFEFEVYDNNASRTISEKGRTVRYPPTGHNKFAPGTGQRLKLIRKIQYTVAPKLFR
jgi:hypothetical protein